ncbi:MAG: hypothetical protein IJL91_10010 [Bacteroidales bacterium]|nr:hypothetical protein [Bacteroidales bacterium]
MDITLGLDFGTHQSKLCMSYMPNNETIYEFVEFGLPDGGKSVLFPSVIQVNADDTIRIGSIDYSTCATRPIPPPRKPDLPKRPDIVFPEEPDQTLPPEPKKEEPAPIIENGADWKDALKSIKTAMESKKNDDGSFKKEHKIWAKKCQTIRERHQEWEKTCRILSHKLSAWQKQVDAINEKFDEEYAYWELHSTEYRILRYFKQAAFTTTLQWPKNEIPADTLSIWYLTYLLLYVKRYVKERFNEVFEENVSVQMGVPSGLNDSISRVIRYRGQRLLVAARHMMELFDSPEEMCSLPYHDLMEMTKYSEGDVVEEAEMYGFVIIPEAYAGLQSLTYSRRLSRGNMHLLVDIGGGTTDIAFFTIDESLLPSIHTVTSFHKGLNFVLENYVKEHPDISMSDAQVLLRTHTEKFGNPIGLYRGELRKELNHIIDHVVQEFTKEIVGTELSTSRLTEAMLGRPIVYCGGGSVYSNMRVNHQYFSDKRLINKETLNIPNLLNRNLDPVLYTILATAYGLSIPTFEEIKTIDAQHLWKIIANNARQAPSFKETRDYGLSDD